MTDLPPLVCSVCHDEYGTASALAAHQRRAHIDRVMHICQCCSAGFLTPAELQLHEITVHDLDVSSSASTTRRVLSAQRDASACSAAENDDDDGDAVGYDEDDGENESGDNDALDSDTSTIATVAADASEGASGSPVFSVRHSEGLKLRIKKIAHSSGDMGSCSSPDATSPSLGVVHRFGTGREASPPSQLRHRHIGPVSPTGVIGGGLLRPPVLDAAKLIAASRASLPTALIGSGFSRGDVGSSVQRSGVDTAALPSSPSLRPVNGSIDGLASTGTTAAFSNGHAAAPSADLAGGGSSGGARLRSPSTVDAFSSPCSSSSPPPPPPPLPGRPQLIRPPTFRPPSAKPPALPCTASSVPPPSHAFFGGDDSGSLIKKPKLVLSDAAASSLATAAAAADGSRGLHSFHRLLLGSTTSAAAAFGGGSSSRNGLVRTALASPALARHPAFGSDAVPLLSPKLADPVLSRLLSSSRPAAAFLPVADVRAWPFEHEPGPGRGRGPGLPFGQPTAAATAAAAAALATVAGVMSGSCLPAASPRVPSPYSPLRTPFSPLMAAGPTVVAGLPSAAAGQSPFSSRSSGCSEGLAGWSFLPSSASGAAAQQPIKHVSIGAWSPSVAEPQQAGPSRLTPPPSLAAWTAVGPPLLGSMPSPVLRAGFFENVASASVGASHMEPQTGGVACASFEGFDHASEHGSAPLLSREFAGVVATPPARDERSTSVSCSAVAAAGSPCDDSPLPPTLERRSPAGSLGSPGAALAEPPQLPLPIATETPLREPSSPTAACKQRPPPRLPPLNGHTSRPTSWHRSEFWEEQLRERQHWKRERLEKRLRRDAASHLVGDSDCSRRRLRIAGKEDGDVVSLTNASTQQFYDAGRSVRGGGGSQGSSSSDSSCESGDSNAEEPAMLPGHFAEIASASANRRSTADTAEGGDGNGAGGGGRHAVQTDSMPSSATVLRPPSPVSISGRCDLDAPSLTISIPLTLLLQCKSTSSGADRSSSGTGSQSGLLQVGMKKRSAAPETTSIASGNDRVAVNGFRSGAAGSSLPRKKFKAAPRRFRRDYAGEDVAIAVPEAHRENELLSGDGEGSEVEEERTASRFDRDELPGLLPGGGCARSGGIALVRCSRYAQDELMLAHLRARACAMLLSLFPHLRVGGHFRPGTCDVDDLVESVRRTLDDSISRRQLNEESRPERRHGGPSQLTVVPSQASRRKRIRVNLSPQVKGDIERLQYSICALLQRVLPHLTWADLQTDGVSTLCDLIDRVTAENPPASPTRPPLVPALGSPATSPST